MNVCGQNLLIFSKRVQADDVNSMKDTMDGVN